MNEQNKKILIIEDDEHVSKVYQVKFAKEGYETVFAKNGEEAIIKVSESIPDIIILDLMIPKNDGFFVLEEIKKNPNLQNVPVIVLSNLGQDSDKTRALELGASEYLVKVEHSMQEVMDKVKSYLDK